MCLYNYISAHLNVTSKNIEYFKQQILFPSFFCLRWRDSRHVHRAQQSSRTVLHSDGSEAKDCQELPSIRLVRSRQWRSKSKVTREMLDWEEMQQEVRSKGIYAGNGIKIINSECYNWCMILLLFDFIFSYLISFFFYQQLSTCEDSTFGKFELDLMLALFHDADWFLMLYLFCIVTIDCIFVLSHKFSFFVV